MSNTLFCSQKWSEFDISNYQERTLICVLPPLKDEQTSSLQNILQIEFKLITVNHARDPNISLHILQRLGQNKIQIIFELRLSVL